MKSLFVSAAAAGLLLVAGAAHAQTTTDEARALAAQATATQEQASAAVAPTADAVAPGDYRAEAHNTARLAQWQAEREAVLAYAAGARSQPLEVQSEVSARAEARRQTAQHELAVEAQSLHS